MSEFNLTGEEEVIARPKGKEYTVVEEETAKKEMTFYGSSQWCKMVSDWQKENPIKPRIYTDEEIAEGDRVVKEANELWKKLKEDREKTRQEALERIRQV